ncbi:MAG: hypothetical protein NT029_04605 [Armatimonadetes bacterium]|nr:hypothetical protein [Armatimonadota bacterium]
MPQRVDANKRFLADLFAGPLRGHGVIMDPPATAPSAPGDYSTSPLPVRAFLDGVLRDYEARAQWSEMLGDDAVPYARLLTHTAVFASAFGCSVHDFEGSNAAARPLVTTAQEADRLPNPSPTSGALGRILELAGLVQDRLGPDVPITGPDYQSPFDIAALVWNKEDMYRAIYDTPDAVARLVAKCTTLVGSFVSEYGREFPQAIHSHCPYYWTPPELGFSLSEDEAGCMSPAMFDRFCMPSLVELSDAFGGLFIHCCADADYQHPAFLRVPNLRAVNRVFVRGPLPTVRDFSGKAVIMVAWSDLETVRGLLGLSLPNTRWLFNMPAQPADDARRTFAQIREWCPRSN